MALLVAEIVLPRMTRGEARQLLNDLVLIHRYSVQATRAEADRRAERRKGKG